MNILSFDIESLEVDSVGDKVYRNCYFYIVDGKRLDWGTNFQPLSYYEILETESDCLDESKLMVILNICSCGEWMCDSYLAQLSSDEKFVYWKVYNINAEEVIDEYTFDKHSYEKTIYELQQIARKEYLEDCRKGAYIFYWKNKETCPFSFSSNKDIIEYWNEKNTSENPLEYFEDVGTGKKFIIQDNKILDL